MMSDFFNIGFDREVKKDVSVNINDFTKHAVVVGATGSGKTVVCKSIIEQAVTMNIPCIIFDPKGDLGGLGIVDENFEFRPFTEYEAKEKGINAEDYIKQTKETYENNLRISAITPDFVKMYKDKIDLHIFTPKNSAGEMLKLTPNFNVPDDFKNLNSKEPFEISNLLDSNVELILSMCGYDLNNLSNYNEEKLLLRELVLNSWINNKSLEIKELIQLVINPNIDKIGELSIDEAINKKRRIYLSRNLNVLSSSGINSWLNGEEINFDKLFSTSSSKTRVNIMDLRSLSNNDKQFFISVVLSELYKWMIKQKGSDTLKYLLYFDELKDFYPSVGKPPSKRFLDLFVRQGRSFGLGCILASQNPGDIDYKAMSNIGIWIIGKLKKERDIDKINEGVNIPKLRDKILDIKQGEFIFFNSITNKSATIKSRWLVSYHNGPLSFNEIKLLVKNEPIEDKKIIPNISEEKNDNLEEPLINEIKDETILESEINKKQEEIEEKIEDNDISEEKLSSEETKKESVQKIKHLEETKKINECPNCGFKKINKLTFCPSCGKILRK